jgi:hypothetical protein
MLRCVMWQKLANISEVLSVQVIEAESTSEMSVSFYQTYMEHCPKDKAKITLF